MASPSAPESDLVFVPIHPVPTPLLHQPPVPMPQNQDLTHTTTSATVPVSVSPTIPQQPCPSREPSLPAHNLSPMLPATPVTIPQNLELPPVNLLAPISASIPTTSQPPHSYPHVSQLPASGVAPPPSSGPHTRSKSGIFKPKTKAYFASRHPLPSAMTTLVEQDAEPTCFTQAS
ncbi:hypothetical protein ACFX19_024248 [Malus domestica]